MYLYRVSAHRIRAREGLGAPSARNVEAYMCPDMTANAVATTHPTAEGPTLRHPATYNDAFGGSLHVMGIAQMMHQLVKIIARLLARKPPAPITVVCWGNNSTRLHLKNQEKREKAISLPSSGLTHRWLACEVYKHGMLLRPLSWRHEK